MRKSATAIMRKVMVTSLNFMCGTWARCSSSAFRSAHLKKCLVMRCLLGKLIKKVVRGDWLTANALQFSVNAFGICEERARLGASDEAT